MDPGYESKVYEVFMTLFLYGATFFIARKMANALMNILVVSILKSDQN